MRLLVLLFVFLFLSACSLYTVTNKTDQNLQLKIAGGENQDLKAGACLELMEYFLGLGGDFPFSIDEYEREFNPNNYEIIKLDVSPVSPEVNSNTDVATASNSDGSGAESTADSTGTTVNLERGYKIVNSDKNLECDPEESEGEDVSLEPVCEDGKKVICDGSKAQCEKGATTPICVDNDNKKLTEVKPICADSSKKPVCKEKVETVASDLEIDDSAQVVCESGTPNKCANGELKCANLQQGLTPICLESNGESDSKPSCSVTNADMVCVQRIEKVEVQTNVTVSCNQGAAQCSATSPVCGTLPQDTVVKPYCANTENIRWPSAVTCPDGSTPTCSQ